MDEMSKIAVAVPGSLGIILAISTFIFMAWLVRFVLQENAKREERLAGIIERDLAAQKMQLDRLEEGHRFQRAEHQTIIHNQEKSIIRQDAVAQILERIVGILTNGKPVHQ